MPSLTTLTVVGVIVLIVLAMVFLRARRQDLLGAIEKKRAGSKLISRADYAEGAQLIPVVLSLTDDTFYYENPELEASFELARIDEIEYADDLMTGKTIHHGCRVLRLRSHGATFEFVLSGQDCAKWMAALKPHRLDDAPDAQAM